MNVKRILSVVLLSLVFVWGLLWPLSLRAAPPSDPAIWAAGSQVCPSGCAFSSIQDAIDAATPGEEIPNRPGVYTGVHVRAGITQVVYISKTITVRGGYNDDFSAQNPLSYPTTVDAQGQGRGIVIVGNGVSPTIEGLRITGGAAPDPLDKGAGVYIENAGGVISGNVIYSNTADYYGGGLYLVRSSTRLVNNDILSNTAIVGSGGGVELVGGTPSLEGNVIRNNKTEYDGGGVYIIDDGSTLTGNTIVDNEAGFGGGVYVINGSPALTGNIIAENTAFERRRAVLLEQHVAPRQQRRHRQ